MKRTMGRKAALKAAVCVSLFFVGCAGVDRAPVRPDSPKAAAINHVLKAYESAWNQHNATRLLGLLDKGFVVWAGYERRIVYTKGTYALDLKEIMRRNRYITLVNPVIWIKGDKATVTLDMLVDGRTVQNRFHLVRKPGGEWLFLDSEW